MNFEPKVLESIKKHDREIGHKKILLLLPFLLALLAALLILIVTAARVQPFSNAPIPESRYLYENGAYFLEQAAVFVKIVVLCTVPFFLYMLYVCYQRAQYAADRFGWFIDQQALEFDRSGLLKFTEALDGVSTAAGVGTPGLIVLDDPAANAMAFTDRQERSSVGVTSGLLRADISVGEANGIMGHELAHLIIGEGMEPPSIWNIEFAPTLLIIAYGILAAVSIFLLRSDIRYVLVGVGIAAAIFAAVVVLQRSDRFILRQLDLAHHHDDILADSLAVTLAKDPVSLASAISKIDTLIKENPRPPGGTILTRYLFVTPPTTGGDYYRYATQVVSSLLTVEKQPRTWSLVERPMSDSLRQLLELESKVTQERLQNLKLIKEGTWRVLGDRSAGD